MKKLLLILLLALGTIAANAQSNISVFSTNPNGTYVQGDVMTYTVMVTNTGPDPASNVLVYMPIPADIPMPPGINKFWWTTSLEYVPPPAVQPVHMNVNLSYTIPTLAVNQTVSFTINIRIPSDYELDINPVRVTYASQSDLVVVNTDNQAHYIPGQNSVYTVTVTNNGPEDATLVRVLNAIPAGITQFSWVGSNGSVGNNVALNNLLNVLPVGETVTYTITVGVPANYTGNLTSTTSLNVSVTDPVPGCTQCSDTDTAPPVADILVTNTDGQTTYTPGEESVYTVTVTNNGPAAVNNLDVNGVLPAGVTEISWVGSNGTSGTGPIDDTLATLANGESVTYTVTLVVPLGTTGDFLHTVGTSAQFLNDPVPACTGCTDTNTPAPVADIEVVNTNGQTHYVAGASSVYTVTVTNNGPSPAANVEVENAIPAGITSFSWTGSNGSSGTDVQLEDTLPALAVGETVTYTITLDVPAGYNAPTLVSTASATSDTTDHVPACEECVDTDNIPAADIVVVNTNNQYSYVAGASSTYTVTVTNNGPSDAVNVSVENAIPTGITSFSWTGSNGSEGTDEPLSDDIPLLAVGETVTYTITLDVPADYSEPSLVSTTAVTSDTLDPDPACEGCTDTDNDVPLADIVISNTNNQISYTAGTTATYTVVVTNAGPQDAENVSVANAIPAGITAFSWTGSNGSEGTDVPLADMIPALAIGESVTYTITIAIPADYDEDFLVSGATVVSSDTDDPDLTCAGCVDSDFNSANATDIVVVNTNGSAYYTAGGQSVYTVTVTNNGPADAVNVVVENAVPAGITDFDWTGSNGSSGTDAALEDTIATLAAGATVTYTVTLQVPADYDGYLISEASATVVTDPDPSCTQCVDTDTNNDDEADIVVTNTNGQNTYIAGTTTVYTVTVSNQGPDTALNVNVSNAVPAGITNFTWTGSNGTAGSGALADVLDELAAGETVTYTITAGIPAGYTGNLVSETQVTSLTADPVPACPACTDTDIQGSANLVTTKVITSSANNQYTAGTDLVYKITITNQGPTEAQNVSVQDMIPAGLPVANVTWSGNGTEGTGNLADAIPVLAVGETVIYTLTVPVPSGYDQEANIANTVNVTSSTPDPVPACPGCSVTATPNPLANIVTLKTNGQDKYDQGTVTTYTITVSNPGPSDAYNVYVEDFKPVNTFVFTWSGNGAAGSGMLQNTIDILPAGESVIYTVNVTIPDNYVASTTELKNTVTVTSDTPDPVPGCFGCVDSDQPNPAHVTVTRNEYSIEELVRDVLIDIQCVDISNITWSAGPGDMGIGYFKKNNSTFPVKSGIILMTGDAMQAGAHNTSQLSTGEFNCCQDDQLFNYIQSLGIDPGLSAHRNATKIEFDFVPLAPHMSFDFVFASEEYGQYQCQFSDAFAFFLTNTTTGVTTNLALVPNTTTPIAVTTIRNSLYNTPGNNCASQNQQYFAAFYPQAANSTAPINFNGRTTIMTAESDVDAGTTYHIKLVIADRNDNALDSAVFLSAGSFDIGQPELPEDITFAANTALCDGDVYEIVPTVSGSVEYFYTWEKDGVLVVDDNDDPVTTETLTIDGPGTYTLLASTAASPDCNIRQDIIIEYYPPDTSVDPENLTACSDGDDTALFNLEQNTATMLSGFGDPLYYEVYYFTSMEELVDDFPVPFPTEFEGTNGQTIYARITRYGTDCMFIKEFNLIISDCNLPLNAPLTMHVCEDAPYDSHEIFDLTSQEDYMMEDFDDMSLYTITYHNNAADALSGEDDIESPETYNGTTETIFVRVEEIANPLAFGTTQFDLIVTPQPFFEEVEDIEVCDSYTLPVFDEGDYYSAADGTGTVYPDGHVLTATTTVYRYKREGNPPYTCEYENDFVVTINETPVVDTPDNIAVCGSYILPALTVGSYYDADNNVIAAGTEITQTQDITIYAETGTDGMCSDTHTFTVTINNEPVLVPATPLELCDDDFDGIAVFDLEPSAGEVINGATNLTVTYHSTLALAQDNTEDIDTPSAYPSATGSVFIRAVETGTTTNCYSIEEVQLTVNPRPAVPAVEDYVLCDDNNSPDGIEVFDLTSKDDDATNGVAGLTVTYYDNETAALEDGTPIAGPDAYANTSSPQTIWVRVESASGCRSVGSFDLIVNPLPLFNDNMEPFYSCEEDPGIGIFDLNEVTPVLLVDASPTIVDYYATQAEAQDGTGPALPMAYTTATTTIYARIESTVTDCISVAPVELEVIPAPVAPEPDDIEVCDPENDGTAVFNMNPTLAAMQAALGNTVQLTVHRNFTEAEAGSNDITNTGSYTNVPALTIGGVQTVYVLAQSSQTDCYDIVPLNLVVNPSPVATTPQPFVLCDDNNSPDGVEVFDLTTKVDEILGGLDPAQYTVTFYATAGNAAGNIEPDTDPANHNSGNGSVFARVTNNDTGCYDVVELELIVNPLPLVATALEPYYACEEEPGQGLFDLSEIDEDVTMGASGVTVAYYETLGQAQLGLDDYLPAMYLSETATIYARIEDVVTHCIVIGTVDLEVLPAPIATQPDPIHSCDPDNNLEADFNLEPTLALIEAQLGNVVTAIPFETYNDAFYGAMNNIITNTTSYTNLQLYTTNGIQTIYIRVESDQTECFDIVELQLIVEPSPVAVEPEPYILCDNGNNDTDGIAVFDLTTLEEGILGTHDPALFTVTFHDELGQIPTPASYSSGSAVIIGRVTNNVSGCTDEVDVELIVNPLPVANPPVPFTVCDENNPGDEVEEFDLTTKIPEIITTPSGVQDGIIVTFFKDYNDAVAGTGASQILNPETYTNSVAVETIFVRATVEETGCYRIVLLDVRVEPMPVLVLPTQEELTTCDTTGLGFGQFDLEALVEDMVNDAPNLEVTFHLTYQDALDGVNPITEDLSNYHNVNPGMQYLYVRVRNTVSNCVRQEPYTIMLIVEPAPTAPEDLIDLVQCDDQDNNGQDDRAYFDLTVQDAPILEHVAPTTVTIEYFTTEDNAINGAPRITNPSHYYGTNGQTIWVRVEIPDTECFSIESFQLELHQPLALTTPTVLAVCDYDEDGYDAQTTIDLTVKDDEILGQFGIGHGNVVTYFESDPRLDPTTPAVDDATAYTNPPPPLGNPKTLYVMVTTTDGCKSYTTLTINVLPLPKPDPAADPLRLCDVNSSPDGMEVFNLSDAAADIRNGDNTMVLTYYESFEDADNRENPIVNYTAYNSGSRTIWVRAEANTGNSANPVCYVIVSFEIIVDMLPELGEAGVIEPYAICEQNTDGIATFDFNTHMDEILGEGVNPDDYTIRFYSSMANMNNNIAMPYVYTNTSSPNVQNIFVRVTNDETECVTWAPLTLLVEEAAIANPVTTTFFECDYDGDNDGVFAFDLTVVEPEVLGTQSPVNYSVTYYTSMEDAEAGENAIPNPTAYEGTPDYQMIWVRVTNESTVSGCYDITTLELFVERLPAPVLTTDHTTVCIDFVTGDNVRPAVINSGLDASHTFVWYKDGVVMTGENSPTLTVLDPGSYTVIATGATGCVSDPVAPVVIERSGPASPINYGYVVGNPFGDNQVITVLVQGYGEYQYSLDNGPWQNSNVFENVSPYPPGEDANGHSIRVRDVATADPCDELELIFGLDGISPIDYPHFFTPNGDGYHDTWNIFGLNTEENKDAKIYIFDRFGKLMKQISAEGEGWDGTFNGAAVPATDYWFTVEYTIGGQKREFKAHFALKR
ncbi:choice-of-anchor L domain-containing protein [Flavobacterium sp. MFBS3-15]|uniref:choice-of-anchor L domain-containing protein n=1 Tax=Flavobacterium sp. MFBS3-15 TaxID=2989816 RepID=UPI002235491D|nr:choice-of-anchor L domain-containing protein [Flavobacterium sp. MFBS3-15]MCW4468234.1 choice-of-anchor L domain-containing protein [Flavobacterium sp. MFBS3-15]